MPNSSSLRKKDKDFVPFAKGILYSCEENRVNWELKSADIRKLRVLVTKADAAYAANSLAATKNKNTVDAKKAIFKELKLFLRWFIDSLVVNLKVPEEALKSMGLRSREHTHHRRIGILKDDISLRVKRSHRQLDLYASVPAESKSTQSSGAKHRSGYLIRRYFKGEEANVVQEISPTLHHVFRYGMEDVGKTMVVTIAWVNPSLQPGKWSEEYEIVLS
jgi:hypothetical protein